jgi:hypothetical protein
VSQLFCDWADASLQCWRQGKGVHQDAHQERARLLHQDRQQRRLKWGRFYLASKVASVGTDNKLGNKVTGAALRPHQGAAAAGDGPAAGTKTLGRQHFGPQGRRKCVCSLREMLGRLRKTPKRQDQGSGSSNNGVEIEEEANFETSWKANKGAGRSATQPQWPHLTNRTERKGTSV